MQHAQRAAPGLLAVDGHALARVDAVAVTQMLLELARLKGCCLCEMSLDKCFDTHPIGGL